MFNPIYTLPYIEFVGGTHKILRINLKSDSGAAYNATNHTATLALVRYENQDCIAHTESVTLTTDSGGVRSIAQVEFNSADTIGLSGRFIYQITITNSGGESEVFRGICTIFRNAAVAAD